MSNLAVSIPISWLVAVRAAYTLKTAKPGDEQLAGVQSLSKRLERLSGPQLTEARGKIAAALPALFRRLTFKPDGIDATLPMDARFGWANGPAMSAD